MNIKHHFIVVLLVVMFFAPITVVSNINNQEQTKEEEPVSEADKKCYETCLKNHYDESTCKGICYSEIKEDKR